MAVYSGSRSYTATFTGGRAPREPQFLLDAKARRAPEQVVFREVGSPMPLPALAMGGVPVSAFEHGGPSHGMPSAGAAAAPEPPAGPAPGLVEFAERVAAAVGAMRLTTERLAEQVRSDVLEVALLIARRIVETELAANVEPLFGVIRSVVRRTGETRRIVIHLCPEDAVRVEAAGGTKSIPGIAAAQVEILHDQSLTLGDCIVEADFGVVDGRLDTRMEELRRILAEAIAGQAGSTGSDR